MASSLALVASQLEAAVADAPPLPAEAIVTSRARIPASWAASKRHFRPRIRLALTGAAAAAIHRRRRRGAAAVRGAVPHACTALGAKYVATCGGAAAGTSCGRARDGP